jgi:hypothetical protein
MSSARDDRRTKNPESETTSKFFLAVFESSLTGSRIYRAYMEPDGISFVFAGPLMVFIDPEVARGKEHGDWKTKAAEALKGGVVAVGGVLVLVAIIILRMAARLALNDRAADATDMIVLPLIIFIAVVVMVVVATTTAVRRLTNRLKQLEAMSPEELREQAESEKQSFRVTAENTSDVRIDPPARKTGQRNPAVRLSIRHEPTGKWKLNLLSVKDVRRAARAFRQILGKDGVEVNVTLSRD